MVIEEDAAGSARLLPVRQIEIAVAPGLERRVVAWVVPVTRRAERSVKIRRVLLGLFGSRRIGVRSPPPPNQPLVVTSMRVLKCAAGTSGLCMCATRLMPLAQKRGSSAAPGIWARNSGLNSP